MKVYTKSNCKIYTCGACGYRYKLYLTIATEEELKDDTYFFGTKPFRRVINTTLDTEDSEASVSIYVCPSCGNLSVPVEADVSSIKILD